MVWTPDQVWDKDSLEHYGEEMGNSQARNSGAWSGAIPGPHGQGPQISEGLLRGNRCDW